MKKRIVRHSLLAVLLLVALLLPFCPTALAYCTGQYYESDPGNTMVTTVQIAASCDYYACCVERDEMVLAGYDCFIVHGSKFYHIMSGKFRNASDASSLRSQIVKNTKYTDAFVTHTYLPDSAIESFEIERYGYSLTPKPAPCPAPQPAPCYPEYPVCYPAAEYTATVYSTLYPSNGYTASAYPANSTLSLGCPEAAISGPKQSALPLAAMTGTTFEKFQYFEDDPKLTMVTTVQVASFVDSTSACSVRDELTRAGYDCFVYHANDRFYVMCGKFNSNSDAEFYLKLVLIYTDYTDAALSTAHLPSSSIIYFDSAYYGR